MDPNAGFVPILPTILDAFTATSSPVHTQRYVVDRLFLDGVVVAEPRHRAKWIPK